MSLDITNFFLITLGGFFMVWGFRRMTKTTHKLSDFEYLAFSTFWGLIFIGGVGILNKSPVDLSGFLKDIYATGFALSVLGFLLGTFAGIIFRGEFNKSNSENPRDD